MLSLFTLAMSLLQDTKPVPQQKFTPLTDEEEDEMNETNWYEQQLREREEKEKRDQHVRDDERWTIFK